jgi:hypothetical protein
VIRWTVAGLIVVGLLVGIWLVWPPDGSSVTTVPEAAETTTTQVGTTTTAASTTTTLDPLQVRDVETVEQAEGILRNIYYGWFEGIYGQDEDRIREVVLTQSLIEAATDQFGVMEFSSEPNPAQIDFQGTEILRSDQDCLVLWTTGVAEFLEGDLQTTGVQVLRWADRWGLYSAWQSRSDLWQDDCESQL